MKDFFKGLKVIELASVLAGPAVGQFFSELGAEVIKIENKRTGGDITRKWKLSNESSANPYSAYYACVNYGKKVEMMDLRDANDQQKLRAWLKEADIVVCNFKEKSALNYGIAYEQVKQLNPEIIYAQLYAFGKGTDRPAFDVVLQAEAGFLYMTGYPGQIPAKMPVALIDLLAAHQLKEGILMALLKKERTGKGSFVSTSLLASAIASLANQATNWLIAGHIPERMGSAHPNIAPYGDIFKCKDGKMVVIAAGTEGQFQQLCKVLEVDALIEDVRFSQNKERVKNREALNQILKPLFLKFNRAEMEALFTQFKVPYGAILNMEELFETPVAQSMILEDFPLPHLAYRRVKTVAFDIL